MSQTIAPKQARLILLGTTLLLMLGMGLRQSFGLFLTPITLDLGVTAADFTLALAVQNVVWGLSQALVGALADRFGLRITMTAGAAIYVIGLGILAAAKGALAHEANPQPETCLIRPPGCRTWPGVKLLYLTHQDCLAFLMKANLADRCAPSEISACIGHLVSASPSVWLPPYQ